MLEKITDFVLNMLIRFCCAFVKGAVFEICGDINEILIL